MSRQHYGIGLNELSRDVEAAADDVDNDIAMGSLIDSIVNQSTLNPAELRQLNYGLNSQIEQEYAADVQELSAWNGLYGEEFGGNDVIFPQGYGQIVQQIAAGLDIRLEQIVTEIAYGDDVTITTNQGDFTSTYVIVTLPLGVLKKGVVSFSPSLPEEKQMAINKLGMGLLNKTYFLFAEPFWEKDAHFIGHIGEQKGMWAEFMNLYKFIKQPVLLGFNAAEYGRFLETLTDEEVIADGMKILRNIYGDSVPDPLDYFVTRWHADPFAGGSYSFVPPGAGEAEYKAMAKPVANRLFFAGEATHFQYPSTVHGAVLSGYREADRIIEFEE